MGLIAYSRTECVLFELIRIQAVRIELNDGGYMLLSNGGIHNLRVVCDLRTPHSVLHDYSLPL